MARDFLSRNVIEVSKVPIDTTGAAVAGDYYSLKDAQGVVFVIVQGAWAGGTPAVTLSQATAVAGTSAKALALAEYYSKVALTGTVNVLTAVVSDTFNLAATPNRITMVEVSAADLDRANGFDCVACDVASPGANADLICVLAIVYGLRYGGDPALLPNPKVD